MAGPFITALLAGVGTGFFEGKRRQQLEKKRLSLKEEERLDTTITHVINNPDQFNDSVVQMALSAGSDKEALKNFKTALKAGAIPVPGETEDLPVRPGISAVNQEGKLDPKVGEIIAELPQKTVEGEDAFAPLTDVPTKPPGEEPFRLTAEQREEKTAGVRERGIIRDFELEQELQEKLTVARQETFDTSIRPTLDSFLSDEELRLAELGHVEQLPFAGTLLQKIDKDQKQTRRFQLRSAVLQSIIEPLISGGATAKEVLQHADVSALDFKPEVIQGLIDSFDRGQLAAQLETDRVNAAIDASKATVKAKGKLSDTTLNANLFSLLRDRSNRLFSISSDPNKRLFGIGAFETQFEELDARILDLHTELTNRGVEVPDLNLKSVADSVTDNLDFVSDEVLKELSEALGEKITLEVLQKSARDQGITVQEAVADLQQDVKDSQETKRPREIKPVRPVKPREIQGLVEENPEQRENVLSFL